MTLNLTCLSLGPMGTNCYLVADSETGDAIAIDPGWDAPRVLEAARQMKAALKAVWLTHAHFDHIGGVAGLVRALDIPVAIHSLDLPLYRALGGARQWGIPLEPGPEPGLLLDDLPQLTLGSLTFEVRFVPGHTPGHVAFYQKEAGLLFGGDVLFQGSIGRTDLPGGDFDTLIASIRAQLLSLPDSTIVYSGHGPQTTIGEERQSNPFL
jgi:hydroxyacylglutathione hydrolase